MSIARPNTDITSDSQAMKTDQTTFLFKERQPQLLLSDPSKWWLLRKNSKLDALSLDLVDDDNKPHSFKLFLTGDGWVIDNYKESDTVPNQISVGPKNTPEQIKALFVYLEDFDFEENGYLKNKPVTISLDNMLLPTIEQMDHSGQFYNYAPSLVSRPEFKLKNVSKKGHLRSDYYTATLDFDILNSKDFSEFSYTIDAHSSSSSLDIDIKCISDASLKNLFSFLKKIEYAQFEVENNDTFRITLVNLRSRTDIFLSALRIAMDLDKNTFESIMYLSQAKFLRAEDEFTLINKHLDKSHYQEAMNAASSRPALLYLLGEKFSEKQLFGWAKKAYQAIPLPESEYDYRTGPDYSYKLAQVRLGQIASKVNSDDLKNQVPAMTHRPKAKKASSNSKAKDKFQSDSELQTLKQQNEDLKLINKNLEAEVMQLVDTVTRRSDKVTNLGLNKLAHNNSGNENKSHHSEAKANSSSQALINRTSQGLSAVSSSSSTLRRSDSWEILDMSAEAPQESNNNTNNCSNINSCR